MSDEIDPNEEQQNVAEEVQADEQQEQQVAEQRRRAYYEEEAITFADIQKHLGGPIISLIFHIIVVIVLTTMISMEPPPQKEREEVVVEMKNMDVEPPPEPEKLPEPPPEEQPQDFQEPVATEFVMTKTPMEHTQVRMETPTPQNSDVSTSDADFTNVDIDLSAMPVVETNNSALKLTGAFAARSPAGRKVALSQFGGTMSSELAVEKSLKWLAEVQNEDGSWGDMEDEYDQKVQLTCLALLAILAHGETPQSEFYGEALMRGLKKVMDWSKANRHESGTDENGRVKYKYNDDYARSRILIVMAEGYAITKIPALENTMNREIEYFIKKQNPIGGFRNTWDHKKNVPVYLSDLDEGSRIYNALYSAYHAGCEHPKMRESMKLAVNAIKTHANDKGGFSFNMQQRDAEGKKTGQPPPGFEATGCGTLYLYLMGDNSNYAEKGYDWLCNYKPKNPSGKEGSNLKMDWHFLPSETPALGWYYMTQALFQGGSGKSKEWMRWNSSVLANLTREQAADGHWDCPADKYDHFEVKKVPVGNKDRKGGQKFKEEKVKKIYKESKLGGFTELNARLWVTVYFTLSLEVYYCYLPTFMDDGVRKKIESANREAEEKAARKSGSKDSDGKSEGGKENAKEGSESTGSDTTTTKEEEDEISLD